MIRLDHLIHAGINDISALQRLARYVGVRGASSADVEALAARVDVRLRVLEDLAAGLVPSVAPAPPAAKLTAFQAEILTAIQASGSAFDCRRRIDARNRHISRSTTLMYERGLLKFAVLSPFELTAAGAAALEAFNARPKRARRRA